jgi:hypothetical protein
VGFASATGYIFWENLFGFWLIADPNPQGMVLNLSIRKVNIGGGLRTLME